MRTTLDIDQDVLGIAKELANQKKQTAGQVLSDLARQALTQKEAPKMRNGIPLLTPKPGATLLTLEEINRLRDEE